MSSPYWDATVEYLDVLEDSGSNWCICNTKLPSLYRLVLHFSYIYTECDKCSYSRYKYKYRKHIYDDEDEDKKQLDLENEDEEEILIQIKNIIKINPKILYIKFLDFTPIEFINRLDNILDVEDIHPFLKHREHCKIRKNQYNLYEILKFAKFEYLKCELIKSTSYRYIKNSNHIGNNAELFQLPLQVWNYMFTFL